MGCDLGCVFFLCFFYFLGGFVLALSRFWRVVFIFQSLSLAGSRLHASAGVASQEEKGRRRRVVVVGFF